jgi:hypothetical protein
MILRIVEIPCLRVLAEYLEVISDLCQTGTTAIAISITKRSRCSLPSAPTNSAGKKGRNSIQSKYKKITAHFYLTLLYNTDIFAK